MVELANLDYRYTLGIFTTSYIIIAYIVIMLLVLRSKTKRLQKSIIVHVVFLILYVPLMYMQDVHTKHNNAIVLGAITHNIGIMVDEEVSNGNEEEINIGLFQYKMRTQPKYFNIFGEYPSHELHDFSKVQNAKNEYNEYLAEGVRAHIYRKYDKDSTIYKRIIKGE